MQPKSEAYERNPRLFPTSPHFPFKSYSSLYKNPKEDLYIFSGFLTTQIHDPILILLIRIKYLSAHWKTN